MYFINQKGLTQQIGNIVSTSSYCQINTILNREEDPCPQQRRIAIFKKKKYFLKYNDFA